jgi:hypothetical protein
LAHCQPDFGLIKKAPPVSGGAFFMCEIAVLKKQFAGFFWVLGVYALARRHIYRL